MLIEAGVLTEQALRVALKEQQRWGGSLGRTVVEMKLVSEHDLVRVLSQQLDGRGGRSRRDARSRRACSRG